VDDSRPVRRTRRSTSSADRYRDLLPCTLFIEELARRQRPLRLWAISWVGVDDASRRPSSMVAVAKRHRGGVYCMPVHQRFPRRLGFVGTAEDRPVIAVTGLSFEARIAGGVTVINDGPQTSAMLKAAILGGARGIVSFGVCGGLDPALLPGQWVIASSVVFGDETYPTDKRWSDRLIAALPEAKHATVAGVDWAITDFQERVRLYARTGAIVADMESHVAARMAAAHNLPFVACRVLINPAHRTLPPAALLKLRPGGKPDLRAILNSVLNRPGQVRHLIRLTLDASIAVFALRRGKLLMEPHLAFPDQSPTNIDSRLLRTSGAQHARSFS
jgi:hopanoid-associated phosphorylase